MTWECSDCRRTLPDAETRFGKKCRICARMPDWRQRAVTPTPILPVPMCPTCKKRPRHRNKTRTYDYCHDCLNRHNRRHQRAMRAKRRKQQLPLVAKPWQNFVEKRERMKNMPGVDIDAIHYKRGKVKVKKAA